MVLGIRPNTKFVYSLRDAVSAASLFWLYIMVFDFQHLQAKVLHFVSLQPSVLHPATSIAEAVQLHLLL